LNDLSNAQGIPIRLRVAVVVRQDDWLLMVYDPKYLGGWWILPGGAVEFGETLAEAGSREVREETGIEVRITGFWKFREILEPDPDSVKERKRRTFEVFLSAQVANEGGELPAAQITGSHNVADCQWIQVSRLSSGESLRSLLPNGLVDGLLDGSFNPHPLESVSLPMLRIGNCNDRAPHSP
jgi:8-oxo-dGTP pyrophosphatase MutT (NUDIX family)